MQHQFNEKDFIKELKSKFTQVEQIIDLICAVNEAGKRGGKRPYMIWYGKGGYGKTAISKIASKHLTGEAPGVMALHEDSRPPDLLGGYDMKKLLQQGEVVNLIQNSILMSKFFVFEEGFQAPPGTLNSLKYLLLEGIHCAGNKCVMLEAMHGLIATNFSPKDWAKTADNENDTLALLERFPFQLLVEWSDYSTNAYMEALQKKYSQKEYEKVVHAVAMFAGHMAQNGTILSPRAIIDDFFPMYVSRPDAAIKYTQGIPVPMRQYMLNEQKNMDDNARLSIMCQQAQKFCMIDVSRYADVELHGVIALAGTMLRDMREMRISSNSPTELFTLYSSSVKVVEERIEALKHRQFNPSKTVIPDLEQLISKYGK